MGDGHGGTRAEQADEQGVQETEWMGGVELGMQRKESEGWCLGFWWSGGAGGAWGTVPRASSPPLLRNQKGSWAKDSVWGEESGPHLTAQSRSVTETSVHPRAARERAFLPARCPRDLGLRGSFLEVGITPRARPFLPVLPIP